MSKKEFEVVHTLKGGMAICGRSGVPSAWPRGHFWVGVRAIGSEEYGLVTCKKCKERLDKGEGVVK